MLGDPDATAACLAEWQARQGAVDFGRFRKAIGPLVEPLVPKGGGDPVTPAPFPVGLVRRAIERGSRLYAEKDRSGLFTPEAFAGSFAKLRELAELTPEQFLDRLPQRGSRNGAYAGNAA